MSHDLTFEAQLVTYAVCIGWGVAGFLLGWHVRGSRQFSAQARKTRKVRDRELNTINRIRNRLAAHCSHCSATPPACGPDGHLIMVFCPTVAPVTVTVNCSQEVGTISVLHKGFVGVFRLDEAGKAIKEVVRLIEDDLLFGDLDTA